MRRLTAADVVWLAAASLTREYPDRTGFSHDEIRRRVSELEPDHGFPDSTIRTHIGSHCVANKRPDPGKHRKLYLNSDGTYRLYHSGDPCHAGRIHGKIAPDAHRIPAKYRDLLEWYRASDASLARATAETDPILALRGVGKELWRELGGGDKFIRELRENWYGTEGTAKRKRAG